MHLSFLKNKLLPLTISICILFCSSCEKKTNGIIDSQGATPTVSTISFPLSVVNTDTINVGSFRSPDDLLTIQSFISVRVVCTEGPDAISSVNYSVFNSQTLSSISEGLLYDDGNSPDQRTGDSLYSGNIIFQIQRVEVGTYIIKISSITATGYVSNTVLLPVIVVRLNHPPVISNLSAPDSISLAALSAEDVKTFTIQIKVIDPDGQQDIKDVLRFTPSGKIFRLFASTDSTYSESVSLVPPPSIGSYNFRFCAVDRSNDSSNVLIKTIVITN